MEGTADVERVMDLLWGMWKSRTLLSGVELDVFSKIEKGMNTPEQLAADLGSEEHMVEKLLNACVALGVLQKEGSVYMNTSVGKKLLVKGAETYWGDMVIMSGKRDSLKYLTEVIKKKSPTTPLRTRMQDPEQAKRFTRAMHNNAIIPAKELSRKFDFSQHHRLLDVGGGSGGYPLIITKKFPHLKATVFDLPNVCAVADEFIAKAGAQANVKTHQGDFFKDMFPGGHDLVLLSQILHSWSESENLQLLEKVYDYLPNNGVVIINEFLLDEQKTSPTYATLFALNMLVGSGKGNAYTEREVKALLEQAGFGILATLRLTGYVQSIIARKP